MNAGSESSNMRATSGLVVLVANAGLEPLLQAIRYMDASVGPRPGSCIRSPRGREGDVLLGVLEQGSHGL